MGRGVFITFEGADGCGKTTQIEKINLWLKEKGQTTLLTREPGGCDLGIHLRKILLHYENPVSNTAETLMYLADRAQHVEFTILPAINRGEVVLCDRYTDSTLAYQGFGREGGIEEIKRLNALATGGLKPDLTIVFDVESEIAQQRLNGEKDRLEAEGMEFHRKLRAGYLEIAKQEPARVVVIDANQDIEKVFSDTKNVIEKKLAL